MEEHDRIIPVKELYIGERFSQPLFFDDGQHMFLASDMPLTQRFMDSLHHWNIPYVVTCGLEVLSPVDEGDNEEIPELEPIG